MPYLTVKTENVRIAIDCILLYNIFEAGRTRLSRRQISLNIGAQDRSKGILNLPAAPKFFVFVKIVNFVVVGFLKSLTSSSALSNVLT